MPAPTKGRDSPPIRNLDEEHFASNEVYIDPDDFFTPAARVRRYLRRAMRRLVRYLQQGRRAEAIVVALTLATLVEHIEGGWTNKPRCVACGPPPSEVYIDCSVLKTESALDWVTRAYDVCELVQYDGTPAKLPSRGELAALEHQAAIAEKIDGLVESQLEDLEDDANDDLHDEDDSNDDEEEEEGPTAAETATLVAGISGGATAVLGGLGLIVRNIYRKGVVAGTISTITDPEMHDYVAQGANGIVSSYQYVSGGRPFRKPLFSAWGYRGKPGVTHHVDNIQTVAEVHGQPDRRGFRGAGASALSRATATMTDNEPIYNN